MSETRFIKVALVGNPNTGKTSLFNALTGLNQKVGNYPGITVEKKLGRAKLSAEVEAQIIDLPGTYSINPTSLDENIVLKTLLNPSGQDYPDVIVVVADVVNIKRNLLLYSQIKDLGLPTILAVNRSDQLGRKGISLDAEALGKVLKTEVKVISARKNQGLSELKEGILKYAELDLEPMAQISHRIDKAFFDELATVAPQENLYNLWLSLTQAVVIEDLAPEQRKDIEEIGQDRSRIKKYQHKETILRYQQINDILKSTYTVDRQKGSDLRAKLDKVLTHKIFGYLIFLLILVLIFQSIFDWASLPMDFIDESFAALSAYLSTVLPEGVLSDLITQGVVPGIGGVVIFIPQIAILFFFVSILEETGYMSRVVFLMDKIMRKFGMSGKSVVPLVSGTACAIPAVMATRNIRGWKERLITILVVPFTTCSARLPVYAILIALVIPDERVFGLFSLQGLTLLGLYFLGFAMAVLAGYVLHLTLKVNKKSFFMIELPDYQVPSVKNILYTVVEKTKAFVFGAGKIILAISIILWFLASNGPASFDSAEADFEKMQSTAALLSGEALQSTEALQSAEALQSGEKSLSDPATYQNELAAYKLEKSYIGIMGKGIEPAIKPLGYDWKIGIALISSFAAREVFVGALATIYSVGEDEQEESTIKERMAAEINEDTGAPLFTLAVGMSLMVFYAFAMQCASTLAIVKRETNSWKWPMLQLFGMGMLAYVAAWITYHIF